MTSTWLRPERRQEEGLQELINRLAEAHGTVMSVSGTEEMID